MNWNESRTTPGTSWAIAVSQYFAALLFVGVLEDIAQFSAIGAGVDGIDGAGEGAVRGESERAFALGCRWRLG